MARRAIGHYNTLSENRSREEQTVYSEFGRKLQARMIALNLNQTDVARFATDYLPKARRGKAQGHTIGRDRISSYIRGKYLPRPEALEAIAKALLCTPADLLHPGGVPSVVEEGPLMEIKSLDGQRVHIRLNRVVSATTAANIMQLLNQEDSK